MKGDIHIIFVNSSLKSNLIEFISAVLRFITCEFLIRGIVPKELGEVWITCKVLGACLDDLEDMVIVVSDREISIEHSLFQVMIQIGWQHTDLLRSTHDGSSLFL